MSELKTRRDFLVQTGAAGAALAGAAALAARAENPTTTEAKKPMADNKKILVAADPYAVSLKEARHAILAQHRNYRGIRGDLCDYELLQALFKEWKPGEVPTKNLAPVALPAASTVYVVDRPGSIQSFIYVGQVAPPKSNPDEIAIELMNVNI